MSADSFETRGKICKVDSELGLVFGFGVVISEQGVDYYDVQGDHATEGGLLEAAVDFAKNMATTDMHVREDGEAVFIFPLTDEIAKAFEIECPRRGLMLAMQPSPEVLAKFKSGEYTGFSIGGERIDETVVEE